MRKKQNPKYVDENGNFKLSLALKDLAISFLHALWFIGVAFYRAWAIVTVWGWFMVPLLSLPALSVPLVFGVTILHGFFAVNYSDTVLLSMQESLKKNGLVDERFAKVWSWVGQPMIITGLLFGGWLWKTVFAFFGVM